MAGSFWLDWIEVLADDGARCVQLFLRFHLTSFYEANLAWHTVALPNTTTLGIRFIADYGGGRGLVQHTLEMSWPS